MNRSIKPKRILMHLENNCFPGDVRVFGEVETLRIIAAMTEVRVIQKILRHLKLAVDPPPIAPARQAAFTWDFPSP